MIVINLWRGIHPQYIEKFIERCNAQGENWKFYLISDNADEALSKGNTKVIRESMNDLASRLESATGLKADISEGNDKRKPVDYRPLFGDIYKDIIKESNFWGYCELDVAFGNLNHFITHKLLHEYDVISDGEKVSSNLALFRNLHDINRLYRRIPSWERIVTSNELQFADEPGISKVIYDLKVKSYYKYWHAHDWMKRHLSKPNIKLEGGCIVDTHTGNEISMFHFPHHDPEWPL